MINFRKKLKKVSSLKVKHDKCKKSRTYLKNKISSFFDLTNVYKQKYVSKIVILMNWIKN